MEKEKSRARPEVRRPRVEVFRRAIETAEADGLARKEMVLHLTHRDVHGLKRDPGIPLEDISFADGVMHYIGVRIVQGGSSASFLGADGRDNVDLAN
ncbi:MAG TPA: hypothetical protein VGF71_15690 [Caulobacteraceae bacterium]|jgi:hypothetical protein